MSDKEEKDILARMSSGGQTSKETIGLQMGDMAKLLSILSGKAEVTARIAQETADKNLDIVRKTLWVAIIALFISILSFFGPLVLKLFQPQVCSEEATPTEPPVTLELKEPTQQKQPANKEEPKEGGWDCGVKKENFTKGAEKSANQNSERESKIIESTNTVKKATGE